ncbi:MAG: hypothetical protein PGN34_25455 [Methylobacterium frigidaeris]
MPAREGDIGEIIEDAVEDRPGGVQIFGREEEHAARGVAVAGKTFAGKTFADAIQAEADDRQTFTAREAQKTAGKLRLRELRPGRTIGMSG